MVSNADLTLEAFTILREHFFDQNSVPKIFPLREKRNTQDNPLDEYIHVYLLQRSDVGDDRRFY